MLQALAKGKRLQADDPFYQRPVAVLANKPKTEMDQALKGLEGLEVSEWTTQALLIKRM